jgi:HlyD family secretion protein
LPEKEMRRKLLLTVVLLLLGASATAGYLYYNGRQAPLNYLTARVERGRIATTVNATGTLNAVITVQVGSQVSGTIQKLLVDYNSPVTEGQIIAQIDPASFEARVSQARANVASAGAAVQVARANVDNSKAAIETAQANIGSAKANVERAKVGLADARRTLERNKQLISQALIAQSDLDVAQTAYDSAVSQLKLVESQQDASAGQLKSATAQARLAEAQHVAALAQVEQAKAALQAADLDLEHTTIRAPVNGIVVSRNVDVGQTVAASLQAPTLFLIAQDLTQMQVDTNVSEADIGRITVGQTATFTVDAFPNTPFSGEVVQVRNAPITVQNVVTYNAVVQVANREMKLKPGMTANVSFLIAERPIALKVANAALRFQPDGAGQEPGAQDGRGAGSSDRTQALQQRLTQALSLSSEQQARLAGILQNTRQQMLRLREQESSEEDRRGRAREVQTQTRAQIRNMLTDAQRQQYEEVLKNSERQRDEGGAQGRPGRVWIRNADGMPQPIALVVGISDDSTTEVLGGDLREGQEVITGILAGAKPTGVAPPGFGPRRPF